MVSTRPFISKSSSPRSNVLVTVTRAPITIGITVTFTFYSFFSIFSVGLGMYPSFRFLSILLCGQLGQQCPQIVIFLFCWLLYDLVPWPRLSDPFLFSKYKNSLCVTFPRTDSELSIYDLFAWSNSQWITLLLCKMLKFDHMNKWFMHNSESVLENETHKLLWDFEIRKDH